MSTLGTRIQQALDDLSDDTGKKHTANWLSIQIGISRAAVYKWMNNPNAGIDGENLLLAAKALKVSPQWLQTGKGPRNDKDQPSAGHWYIQASTPEELAEKLASKDPEEIAKIIRLLIESKNKYSGH